MSSQASMRAQAAVQAIKCVPLGRHQILPVQMADLTFRRCSNTHVAPQQNCSMFIQRRSISTRASSNGSTASTSGLAIDLTGGRIPCSNQDPNAGQSKERLVAERINVCRDCEKNSKPIKWQGFHFELRMEKIWLCHSLKTFSIVHFLSIEGHCYRLSRIV